MKKSLVDHTYSDYSQMEISDLVEDYKGVNEEWFPAKLHRMLSTPEYAHIIAWKPHGRAWAVLEKKLFIDVVLPRYFNHGNFESFNRSVNGWGFKRLVREGPDQNSYYHELFLCGRPELTSAMSRLINPGKRLPNKDDEPDFYDISKKYPLRDPPTTAHPYQDDQADSDHKRGSHPPSLLTGCPAIKPFKSSYSHQDTPPQYPDLDTLSQSHLQPPPYYPPYYPPRYTQAPPHAPHYSQSQPPSQPYSPPYSQPQDPAFPPHPTPNPPQFMRHQHPPYPSKPPPSYRHPTPYEAPHYSPHYPSPGHSHSHSHYSPPGHGPGHSSDQTHQYTATAQTRGPPPNAPFHHYNTPWQTPNIPPYEWHSSSPCYNQHHYPLIMDHARHHEDHNPVKMLPVLCSNQRDRAAHPDYTYTNPTMTHEVNETDERKNPVTQEEGVIRKLDHHHAQLQASHSRSVIDQPTPLGDSSHHSTQSQLLESFKLRSSTLKSWHCNKDETVHMDPLTESLIENVAFDPAQGKSNIMMQEQHDSFYDTPGTTNDNEQTMRHADFIHGGVDHGIVHGAHVIPQEEFNPLTIDNFHYSPKKEEEHNKKDSCTTVHPSQKSHE